jgi:thioredoxin reductase (NADPH)
VPPTPAPDELPFLPSDPYRQTEHIFPTLTAEQVERIRPFGTEADLAAGEPLFAPGDRTVDFFVVLAGCIEITDPADHDRVVTVHTERQFTGEIDLFNARKILVGGRMGRPGRVVRVPRAEFRKLLLAEPDIGDVVMRAFVLRRMGLITHEQASVTLVASRQTADSLRLERFLRRNGYPVRTLDADRDAEAADILTQAGKSAADCPVVVCPGGHVLTNPTPVELADCLGLAEPLDPHKVYDVAVVGAGPAGLAAAVYAASEGLSVVVLEAEAPGGQAGQSSKIENYLGFPTGVSGQGLAARAQVQAMKFGATIALPRTAVGLDCGQAPFRVRLSDGTAVRARTVVVATGARYRGLGLPECKTYEGVGVHYAASAVEARLCASEEVAVVGGGNSAGQAAVYLARHAKRVHVLVRGDGLAATMSDYLVGRITAGGNIELHTRTEIVRLSGEKHLAEVTWKDRTGTEYTKAIRHVFLMVGAVPNTDWLGDCLAKDDKGFVCVGPRVAAAGWPLPRAPHLPEASVPGVFAAGDCRADSVKRVASAVGEGSIAVQFVHRVLEEQRAGSASPAAGA